MSTEKADYSSISQVYDDARPSDAPHLAWWFAKIAGVGRLGPGKRLIDLGCGTGRWTIPLAERTGCEAVGVDSSKEMLTKAREKDREGRVTWLLGDVERLEVDPESFDCALMSLMMHHLEDHQAAFRRVFAALRPGGALLIRQGTLVQILRDAVHRFFPEAVAIDRRRTPFRSEVEWWLQEAGFDPVEAEEFKQTSYPSNERFLKEMRLRVCSVLRLMPDEAFEAGLRRLTRHVRIHPEDSSLRQDLFTLFTARKPE